jgi:hypothetical protein
LILLQIEEEEIIMTTMRIMAMEIIIESGTEVREMMIDITEMGTDREGI